MSDLALGPPAAAFERCIAAGGIALFPSDTVYGLACDAQDARAVERLYALKQRPVGKAAAVMFGELEAALLALPDLGHRTRAALGRLLPGALTVLLGNPSRSFPLACGADPTTLGLRVPELELLAALRRPVLQSSANHAGGPEACRLQEVPAPIRAGADLVLNGGRLAGRPSTVVDLRGYEGSGSWSVTRAGAVGVDALHRALGSRW